MAGAGTLWVTVKPSLEGFGTDLRRQIEQSIPPEIKVKIKPDGDPAQDGAQQAGAFADAYKARLKAALSDLPKVEITADSSDADRAIADIRARMETLRDLRIGIDIDAGAAQARLAELEAELSRLAAQSPNVQVKVDAASAAAELAAFQAEVQRLDGEQANVKVDTSQATSSMSALMTAGLALGPALIPIGAAVAAGLASIGPAALAAAGALGVLGLAFSGIGKAISAADTAQQQAGANATQSANQQANAAAQIASAQDGVASAERSLAQARAQAADGAVTASNRVQSAQQAVADAERNAADAAVSAAERVQNAQQAIVTAQENAAFSIQSAINAQISAEEALANAQRAEQTAQENLTQARKDAAAQLQSLTFSVQDNALNQRAADLSLQQAEANLAGLGSGATQLQRDQAQLAVDQAKQRIVELQAQGKQLADQKAEADQKGIEGSSQVTAAQDAVTAAVQRTGDAQRALEQANANVTKAQTDGARSVASAQQALADAQRAQATQQITSQESIAKAEQQLADARRAQALQQMTSANSIASAEQGVVSAQRALESAQRSAAQAADGASTATKNYAQAMAALSPAGRDFVNFYESQLKPKLDELKAAAQSGLLPGLQQGLTTAFPALDQLKTFVTNVSSAMGDLAKEAGKALTSPFWHDFFDFMNQTAAPTIKTLAETFGNFITGVAGIMQALYEPVFVPIMNWFRDLAVKIRDFGVSAAAGTNGSFNSFLQYVKDNGPNVRDLIGELAKLIGRIIDAMSGQGAGTLSILVDVLRWINGLPLPVIQGLIDLFIAFKVAQLGAGLISGVAGVLDNITTIKNTLSDIKLSGGLVGALGVVALVAALQIASAELDKANAKWQLGPDGKPTTQEQKTVGQSATNDVVTSLHDTVNPQDRLSQTTWEGFWNPQIDFKNSTVGKLLADMKGDFAAFPAEFDKSPFMNFWRGLPGFFSGLGTQISTGASNVKTSVTNWWNTNVWNPTRDFFTNLPGTVKTWWDTNVWNPTRDWFASLPGNVKTWWTTSVWNPTRDFFTGLPGTISKWWNDNVWNPTKNFFTSLPGTVSKWWTDNVWNPTRDFFAGLPGTIGKWWTDNVWTPTKNFFTGLPGTISKWWTDNVWNPTRDFFTGLPGTISKWWTDNVWNPTRDFFTSLPGTVTKWWNDNVWNPTRDWFAGLPGTVTKWWNDNVWNPTSAWFAALPATVTNWWNTNVWNPTSAWFAGLPATITKWWTDNVSTPSQNFFNSLPSTVTGWWNNNITNPLNLAAAGMWDGIVKAFKHGVNLIAGAIRGFNGTVDIVTNLVGLGDLLPKDFADPFPGFAGGGVLPGYSPGVDSVPALLSPGEAVLVPELVRAIGPHNILAANAAASGRPAGGGGRFAGGGVLPGVLADFGSGLSDLASWVTGGLSGIIDKIKAAFTGTDMFSKIGSGTLTTMAPHLLPTIANAAAAAAAAALNAITGGGSAVPSGPVAQVVQQTASQFGWGSGPEWDALSWIISHESGWNPNAQNPTSTAYGLFQFLNGTWASTGIGKTSDPSLQALAGMRYIQSRYRDPVGAQRFWQANGWYADGAIFNGPQVVGVGEAGPEMLLPLNRPERTAELLRDSGITKTLGDTGRGLSSLDLQGLQTATAEQTAELKSLNAMLKRRGAGASITVNDRSGDPAETARTTMLALRFA